MDVGIFRLLLENWRTDLGGWWRGLALNWSAESGERAPNIWCRPGKYNLPCLSGGTEHALPFVSLPCYCSIQLGIGQAMKIFLSQEFLRQFLQEQHLGRQSPTPRCW